MNELAHRSVEASDTQPATTSDDETPFSLTNGGTACIMPLCAFGTLERGTDKG